jgi:hypothetical protein
LNNNVESIVYLLENALIATAASMRRRFLVSIPF